MSCHALLFFEFHSFFYWSTWEASFIYRCLTLVTGQASEAWCPPRTICCWRIVLERGIYISDALVRYYIALLFGWVRLWNQHCFYPSHWKSLIIQMFKMSMFIIFFCVQSEICFALQNVIFSLLSLEFLTLLCLMCVYNILLTFFPLIYWWWHILFSRYWRPSRIQRQQDQPYLPCQIQQRMVYIIFLISFGMCCCSG